MENTLHGRPLTDRQAYYANRSKESHERIIRLQTRLDGISDGMREHMARLSEYIASCNATIKHNERSISHAQGTLSQGTPANGTGVVPRCKSQVTGKVNIPLVELTPEQTVRQRLHPDYILKLANDLNLGLTTESDWEHLDSVSEWYV